MKYKNYNTVSQKAKEWNLSERTVRNYCAIGKIYGAVLEGKTWLIPFDAIKPEKIIGKKENYNVDQIKCLCDFLSNSPVSFIAIDNVSKLLNENGYVEFNENKPFILKKGDKVYFRRNGSSLIALNVGDEITYENCPLHIIASHSDSPCFKLKPEADGKTDIYNKINVEPYGGMLCSTWLDRPLSIAGRVLIKENNNITVKVVNFDENLVLIPNMCIHFNREANSGYAYNMASDMQAFIGQELEGKPLKELLTKKLCCEKEDILNFDLYLVNNQRPVIWGQNKEYISAPRLDDLECVYASTEAFRNNNNPKAINVLYISDNEEVGSSSRQGANSDFLETILERTLVSLGYKESNLGLVTANSFMVSADNAHAVHPNNPGVTDSNNKAYMNKGVAIKFNAAQSYTSDGVSSSIFQQICNLADVPYQFFTNRSDKRGGSTLGNILLSHISLMSVDIGLPQLAMHSSFETAGCLDVEFAIKAFSKFYSSNITIDGTNIKID